MNNSPQNIYNVATKILDAKKKVLDILLKNKTTETLESCIKNITSNIDLIGEEFFDAGIVIGSYLKIDIMPISFAIDLSCIIKDAILDNNIYLIDAMIKREYNIFKIQPYIMIQCVEKDQDELLSKLIKRNGPIHIQNYRCIYQLASKGKIELIKEILNNYNIDIIDEIVGKIIVQAILNNHCSILEYFLTQDVFMGAPDQMFEYFAKSVEYNADIDIIRFFLRNGLDIRQQNYRVVKTAISKGNLSIIKYLCEFDNNVENFLTDEQKEKFGILQYDEINQYIGNNNICDISFESINSGDKYFQCCDKRHYFKENIWKNWLTRKCEWICPYCFCSIDKKLYINI